MKIYRKALIAIVSVGAAVALLLSLTGCFSNDSAKTKKSNDNSASPATGDEANAASGLAALGIDPASVGVVPDVKHDAENVPGFQLELPKEGDTVGVIRTSQGDIVLRFFPDQAPKTVTNFINLAKAGSYNNTSFHMVINDVMIQGGHCGTDPSNPSGQSSYGDKFEDEFCDSLLNLRGAVSMTNTSKDGNGSQFLINVTTVENFAKSGSWDALEGTWDSIKSKLLDYKDSNLLKAYIDENGERFTNTDIIPDDIKMIYDITGGNPSFDGMFNAADRGNTVFAQVISGMDVVDKIAAVKTDDKGVPQTPVLIESVTITTYASTMAPTTMPKTAASASKPAQQ